MALNKLSIKPFYNSQIDNIIEDFYIPLLSNSSIYKRVSAYFDSNIILLYSKGIENIVEKSGHIYFIFSCEISERDFNIIKNGYEERELIYNKIASGIHYNSKSLEVGNLGYLIKHNYVDIKIAFTTSQGVFHDKFGLFESKQETVYFRGSNNETIASVKSNFESFETSCSWNSSDTDLAKILNAKDVFDKLWNNVYTDSLHVISIPNAILNKLISYSSDKLVFTQNINLNSLVMDYQNNRFMVVNNLKFPEYLSPGISFYKRYFQYYISEVVGNEFIFSDDTPILHIKLIIDEASRYASRNDFQVFISPTLRKFINDYDILIEKRRNLGYAIKCKSELLIDDFSEFEKIVNYETDRKLRIPQLWDAYHIARMMRSANFSVPGSGKTSIVYGAFAYLNSTNIDEIDRIVVIGPLNSFLAWKNEFRLCFGNKKILDVFNYQEDKDNNKTSRHDQIAYLSKKSNLVLINYESLGNNITALNKLVDRRTLLVFDEVHRIKSITGTRAMSAKKIIHKARYRVALTGTPIPNGYIDLYNLLNILFSEEYDTFFGFDHKYLNSAKDDYEKQNEINEVIYPFFCRTTKDELKVPSAEPDNIIDGYGVVTQDENLLFETIYRIFGHNILSLYIRLIQASNNPSLLLKALNSEEIKLFNTYDDIEDFSKNDIFISEKLTESDIDFISKFDMTSKFFRGINLTEQLSYKGPVIVWGIFIDTLKRIKKELAGRGISAEIITGEVPLSEREQLINDFQLGKFMVLVSNPHTLAESVSLHNICHQAVYFEYSFNLVHMLQSRDRIHRLGLDENMRTYYYYLMIDNPDSVFSPIDRKIYNRLIEKRELQEKALATKNISVLFEDYESDVISILKGTK